MGNIIKKESVGSVEMLILAPGVHEKILKVSADKESSNLYVDAKPELVGTACADEVELGISHAIEVDAKYDVSTAKVSVSDGIIRIVVSANSERIIDIHPSPASK